MMSSSWNDVIEDDTNEEIVQVLGTDDGGNIREEPNIEHLALPNVIIDEVAKHEVLHDAHEGVMDPSNGEESDEEVLFLAEISSEERDLLLITESNSSVNVGKDENVEIMMR